MPLTDIPPEYIKQLTQRLKTNALAVELQEKMQLLMYSGALLNWVGEYLSDESIHWHEETVLVKHIYLTGTGPAWNKIIIDQARRKPAELKRLLNENSELKQVFAECQFEDTPILLRQDGEHLKVLNGMHRTIAAIRDKHHYIQAYIGTRSGKPLPLVEPHVVYDILRAFTQYGGDSDDFIASLRFLIHHYENVQALLQTRFKNEWELNESIAPRIDALLK